MFRTKLFSLVRLFKSNYTTHAIIKKNRIVYTIEEQLILFPEIQNYEENYEETNKIIDLE
jgi:hypothetical protein